jgi:predicted transcriptional regulator
MVITLEPDLEAVLNQLARTQGVEPEHLALQALRERFLRPVPPIKQDEWERDVLAAGSDCGVSLSNEAVSSEGLYD